VIKERDGSTTKEEDMEREWKKMENMIKGKR
jgi:hypothetical protein